MAKRQVFFSFEYLKDNWRASQVRNMGKVSDDSTFSDNDWEEVKRKGDDNIKKWISDQLKYRSCTIVLIGEETSERKWVKYEIKKSWEDGKGVLGIYIHNLKNQDGERSKKGKNPFEQFTLTTGDKLSSKIKVYDPPYGFDSKANYNYIAENIEDWIETAINDRK